MIKHIAFTAYPAHDIKRARQFYEGLLGFTPSKAFGESWQEYDLGDTAFVLVEMSDQVPEAYRGEGRSVAFEVDDLDAVVARLREAGVKVLMEPWDSPGCRACALEDTEGNTITLHQLKR